MYVGILIARGKKVEDVGVLFPSSGFSVTVHHQVYGSELK